MFKKAAFAAVIAFAALTTSATAWSDAFSNGLPVNEKGILQVGTNEAADITVAAGVSREDVLSYPGATYIAVKFDAFNLPEGDEVVVRSPDSTVSYKYTGKGRGDDGSFYSTFIPGDKAVVEYVSRNKEDVTRFGYTIPAFARGYQPRPVESICGKDDSVPAKCYANSTSLGAELPLAYERSQTVARLLIGGTSLCTGWLAGSDGHMITNEHCIEEASSAAKIDIEFEAESASCEDKCETQLGCKGTVVATTSTFVTNDKTIDYAVIKLPESADLKKYGYLQLRESGPVVKETIYIPQHPVGWAKRIAAKIDSGADATVESVGVTLSCGNNQVGYSADTQGGSSGSPLLAKTDNNVVALHHCGGCSNQAVDIRDVIADLKSKNIVINNLIAGSNGPTPLPTSQTPAPTSQTPAPTTKTPAPTTKTPAPTTKTPAPTTKTPAPTTKTPAPTTKAPTNCSDFGFFSCPAECNWSWSSWSCEA
ncbi:hypothetical protein Poli38472_006857 [Pythium oligandrum]|uniref:Serine protease n=1 Tax=Pythium oligandrum TaxID=41045 RepID=A0A8K1C6B5_PYTOL|nr:hypothetical protein Poli38472_006857 [Pythium oligandrum]|eukprot:TMW56847.1 hypothetical protein Poli38472_006857 [Pythium oligandrum]